MSKVSGKIEEFVLFKKEGTRIVVNYEMIPDEGGLFATWQEVIMPINLYGEPGTTKEQHDGYFNKMKDAIIEDIDKQTKAAILNGGYEWTVLHGEDAGKTVKVWLSDENQTNYKAKHDTARQYPNLVTWPMKYKISEGEDKTPIYEYFENIEELAQFYLGGVAYIEQCYQNGWQRKDSIDWDEYKPFFPVVPENL